VKEVQEPTNRHQSGVPTWVKVLGGLFAFFILLCMGFVFFIAVVCGK
jgi:hypothetical protein